MKKLKSELKKRLKTVELAYKEVGEKRIDFSIFPESKRVYKEAQYDAEILVEAARKIERENGSGEIEWNDRNQRKWIPWFIMGNNGSPSGFRFCASDSDNAIARAGSGSRLRVLFEETADFLGKNFPEIWENIQIK